MRKLTKTELKVLDTITEFTRDGYGVRVFGFSDKDMAAVRSLESIGLIGHRMGLGYFALPCDS